MLKLTFRREVAGDFYRRLARNESIPAPFDGWTKSNSMMLSAACHGVLTWRTLVRRFDKLGLMLPERFHGEAHSLRQEMSAGLEFFSELTQLIHSGDYDEEYQPVVSIHCRYKVEDDETAVRIVKGRKVRRE